jgi:hypothetical protein
MPVYDLHSHSTSSDGVLSPRQLVDRAADHGVDFLAITDHDEMRGLIEARATAAERGIELVSGVEVSITWRAATVHIVGLRVNPDDELLASGLGRNRAGRTERAERMAEELAKLGVPDALAGAYTYASNKDLIGRTHFARYLVEYGLVKDVKTVFKKYLVKGKPGYVHHEWASLADALAWIRAAGGQSVVAHPGRYHFGRERMRDLLREFKELGGDAIEVVTGSHTADQVPVYADLAVEYDFLASVGSDFHAPGEGGRELGRLMPLPLRCRPVWERW